MKQLTPEQIAASIASAEESCQIIDEARAGMRTMTQAQRDELEIRARHRISQAQPASGFNGGVKCDSTDGPCACGAWHKPDAPVLTKAQVAKLLGILANRGRLAALSAKELVEEAASSPAADYDIVIELMNRVHPGWENE
jgi:hypothetical protein